MKSSVLIVDSLAKLPATVISRCQQFRVAPASDGATLEWLRGQTNGADLTNLLDFTGGAPLQALELHEAGFAETANGYAGDLRSLENREISPIVVADRWKSEPELALRWLYWRLARRVRASLEARTSKDSADLGQDSLQPEQIQQTLQACFRQMGQIRELRRLINGGINAELNLAELLMDWYGGLGRSKAPI